MKRDFVTSRNKTEASQLGRDSWKYLSQLKSCVDIAQKYIVKGDKVKYVPIFVGGSREAGILEDKYIRVNGRQQQIHILRSGKEWRIF